jgi:hypothetical protein
VEVQVQMRNVALHVDDATILQIARLRGALVSTEKGRPPTFDDKTPSSSASTGPRSPLRWRA